MKFTKSSDVQAIVGFLKIVAVIGAGGNFTLYEEANFKCCRWFCGTCQKFNVAEDDCLNLDFYNDKVSSIDTHSTCITIWEKKDCSGAHLKLRPDNEVDMACAKHLSFCLMSGTHDWDNEMSSVSGCSYQKDILGYPSRFVFQAQEKAMSGSNTSFNGVSSEAGELQFELPTQIRVQCNDTRWNPARFNPVPAEIEKSKQCLELSWKIWNETEAEELWTISGTKGCKRCHMEKITNCKIAPHKNSTGQPENFMSVMANLGDFPTPYELSTIQPSLFVYRNGRNVFKIPFKDSWRRPLFKRANGLGLPSNAEKTISTVIIISPGFLSKNNEDWVMTMKDTILLHRDDVMVVTLGWSMGSRPWFWNYPQAMANSQIVGEYVGNIVVQLKSEMPSVQVWGIGFSLGAHLIGKAGRSSGMRFDRITGLDPAGPGFEDSPFEVHRLTKDDGKFVDVIHTDGGWGFRGSPGDVSNMDFFNPMGHYGTYLPCGHADFYPNWGYRQPPWWKTSAFGAMSHIRAHELFLWSITNPDQMLTSVEIDGNISLASPPRKWKRSELVTEMGFHATPGVEGNFYLQTNSDSPWVKQPEEHLGTEMAAGCADLSIPRVRSETIVTGRHTKIDVYANSGGRNWEQLYTVYWNPGQMTADLTVHELDNSEPEFEIQSGQAFLSTLCSHGIHQRPGGILEGSEKDSKRLIGMYKGVFPAISSAYTQSSQKVSMELQGVDLNRFFDEGNYLIKGHLVPNGDFNHAHVNRRKATYLYANVLPMWDKINNGNWKILENYLREMSKTLVFTVLTLPLGQLSYGGRLLTLTRLKAAPEWNRLHIPEKLVKVVIGRLPGRVYCSNTFVVENEPEITQPYNVGCCPAELARRIDTGKLNNGKLSCSRGVTQEVIDALNEIDGRMAARTVEVGNQQPCF